MPIDNLPHRHRELGRLKFGEDLGDRPTQLDTWRLVSPDPNLIQKAAELYGGTPTDNYGEVITTTSVLEVLLPPQDVAAGQFYELWTRGGLQRRCTGTNLVAVAPDGRDWTAIGECACDPEDRECRIRTHLRVVLPQLPDIGIWRLTTASVYAATELPTAAEVITRLAGGDLAPAELALEKRWSKKPGRPQYDYIVPVLRVHQTISHYRQMLEASDVQTLRLDTGDAASETQALATSAAADVRDRIPSPAPDAVPDTQTHATGAASRPDETEPDIRAAEPRETPWTRLAAFLAAHPLDMLADSRDQILEVLAELEALMVDTGAWTQDALQHAAEKRVTEITDPANWGDWRSWEIPKLKAFAIRALLSAHKELDTDPRGRKAKERRPSA